VEETIKTIHTMMLIYITLKSQNLKKSFLYHQTEQVTPVIFIMETSIYMEEEKELRSITQTC
jgi:hypothetical protein